MSLNLMTSRSPVETRSGTGATVRIASRATTPFGNLTAFAGAPER